MNAVKSVFLLFAGAILIWIGMAVTSSPIAPQAWVAPSNPGLAGDFASNQRLADVLQLGVPGIGPEDVACGPDGRFYSGLVDGQVVRWGSDGVVEPFANTQGRPLGMVFDSAGRLVIADAVRGLIRLSQSGEITVLADTHLGVPLAFVDDVDIATDGTIWFSDASMRFGFDKTLLDFFEGSMTGRLMSYKPETGQLRVHMDGLFFANGVALGPDDEFVLINETGMGRVHRLWLKGDKLGQRDIFVEHLPGTPDNINFDDRGAFWIALPSLRDSLDSLSDKPFVRKLMSVLPESALDAAANVASFVIAVNLDGEVIVNLQDPELGYNYITSATPCGDTLWLGSLHMPSVAKLPLPITN